MGKDHLHDLLTHGGTPAELRVVSPDKIKIFIRLYLFCRGATLHANNDFVHVAPGIGSEIAEGAGKGDTGSQFSIRKVLGLMFSRAQRKQVHSSTFIAVRQPIQARLIVVTKLYNKYKTPICSDYILYISRLL